MIVGVKSGTFRIIHSGHIWMIKECMRNCDYLIVLTNDDEYLLQKKGAIITPLKERISIIRGLKYVNEVHWFSGDTETGWIKKFKEERLYPEFGEDAYLRVFHSAELKGLPRPPAYDIADDIMFIDRIPGSTTNIIKKIRGIR